MSADEVHKKYLTREKITSDSGTEGTLIEIRDEWIDVSMTENDLKGMSDTND